MSVDTMLESEAWEGEDLESLAERAVGAAVSACGLVPEMCDVSLLACDDARIAALNAQFRGKPAPTNVLSWPEEDLSADAPGGTPLRPAPGPDGRFALGDIALAYGTCAREADAAGRPLADHATHLIVHGTLHLLGYDHETDADAALMEGLEITILGGLGIGDPYEGA